MFESLSLVLTTPAMNEKFFVLNIFSYFVTSLVVHLTFVNLIFAHFSFSGLGKPVLSALSYR